MSDNESNTRLMSDSTRLNNSLHELECSLLEAWESINDFLQNNPDIPRGVERELATLGGDLNYTINLTLPDLFTVEPEDVEDDDYEWVPNEE